MNPVYPIFVPSRGRYETCLTMHALDAIGVPYRAVVEEFEAEKYAKAIGEETLLIQPTHKKGLVVTRNWIWDYAERLGTKRF
jgi:hypothetical protein